MALAYLATGTVASDATGPTLNVPYAGSPSYGNLMVIHVQTQSGADFTTPSGWTRIGPEPNDGSVFWKIAAGGETGSVAVTSSSGSSAIRGVMMLFEGSDPVNPINISATDTDYTIATVTPTVAGTLWVLLAGCNNATGTPTYSAYAMATDNPTWTERYDSASSGQIAIAAATSTIRSAITATGNCTVTVTGTANGQNAFVFAIAPGSDVAIAPDLLTLTSTFGEPAFTPNVIEMNATLNGGDVARWSQKSKPTTTWTNTDKTDG